MEKDAVVAALRRSLDNAINERTMSILDPARAAARHVLRQFQSARLARTHADLLQSKETRAAAQFFLEDLYGTNDFTRRDADIERIIPMMEHMLPLSALQYIAEAIELDSLSESLDSAMATRLGEYFTEDEYIVAYQAIDRRVDREKQIEHVNSVGHSLCELVRRPMIGTSLAAMRIPAKLAKLSELHHFLERGYTAFKKMEVPENFVTTIVSRETTILDNIFSKKTNPFKL